MKTKDVADTFKQLGWKAKLNVDRYAEKDIGDRIARVSYRLKTFSDYCLFEGNNSLRTAEFTAMVKAVEGGRKMFNDMLKPDFDNRVWLEEPIITRAHIEWVSHRAVEWAMSVDIDARYRELARLDPSAPGAAGVWHLAALALLGGEAQLTAYQARFAAGDRCGFALFITDDYIDRAVTLAQGVARKSPRLLS